MMLGGQNAIVEVNGNGVALIHVHIPPVHNWVLWDLETALLVTNSTPRCLKAQHLATSSEAIHGILIYTRREVFMALCIVIVVCWVVRPCSLILNTNILHEHGGPGQHVSYSDQATGWMIRGSIPQIIKTSSETHPASYSMVTAVTSPGGAIGCGKNLTAHQHLVLRLRKHGAVTLLTLHAFMMQTGTKLPFLT